MEFGVTPESLSTSDECFGEEFSMISYFFFSSQPTANTILLMLGPLTPLFVYVFLVWQGIRVYLTPENLSTSYEKEDFRMMLLDFFPNNMTFYCLLISGTFVSVVHRSLLYTCLMCYWVLNRKLRATWVWSLEKLR